MKKGHWLWLGFLYLFAFVAMAFANNQVKILVNGQEIDSDVAPKSLKTGPWYL